MEEKYPIKFTLGQFVLLLGVAVVLFSLIFLLGARFGGQLFPDFYAKQFGTQGPLASLAPTGLSAGAKIGPKANLLVDTIEDEVVEGEEEILEEDNEAADFPEYQVGADGSVWEKNGRAEEESENLEPVESESVHVNQRLIHTKADPNTVIRFKSSGNSRFTVEVADYFDEFLASHKITELKNQGLEAYIHIKNPGSEAPTFSVRVGAFADRSLAERFATDVSNKQNLELRVVQMN